MGLTLMSGIEPSGGAGTIDPVKEPRIATISQGAEGNAIPIVYGQARVAGRLFVVASSGNYLVLAYALSLGPISSIASYTIDGYTAAEITSFGGIDVSTYTGTSGQTANSYLTTAISGYAQKHPYLAYIVLRISANSKLWGSIPEVVATVNGRSDVYDPRTAGNAYTANPALVAAHIATSYDAGGWPTASVDWDRIGAVANYFDTDVGGVDRYSVGVVLTDRRSLREQLQTLLKQCRAYETWREGKWSVWTDGATFPSRNLVTANIATGTDTSEATTGFTSAGSAVLSSSTEHAWQANRSLKVVTPGSGTGEGVTFACTTTPGTTYTVSVRLRASAACTLTDSTAIGAMSVGTEWQRFTGSVVAAGASTTFNLVTSGSAQAVTLYVDGIQVEAAAAATTWDLPSGAAGPEIGLNWMVADASRNGTKLRVEETTLSIDQVPDLVRVRYTDASREWEYAEQRYPLAGLPGGSSREVEISAPWITSAAVAARLAEETYNERQASRRLRLTTFRDETPLERGRLVTVDGVLDLSASSWRIANVSPRPDGTTELVLAQTYSAGVQTGAVDTRVTPDVPRSTNAPDPPTNLSLTVRTTYVGGLTHYEIAASWTKSPSSNVAAYQVVKVVSAVSTTVGSTERDVSSIIIPVTQPGEVHTIGVYAVSAAGDLSTDLNGTVTPGGSNAVSLSQSTYLRTRKRHIMQDTSGAGTIQYDAWSLELGWSLTDSGSKTKHLELRKNGIEIARFQPSVSACYVRTQDYVLNLGEYESVIASVVCSGWSSSDTMKLVAVLKDGRESELTFSAGGSWTDRAASAGSWYAKDLACVNEATYNTLRGAANASPTASKSPVFNGSDWGYQQIIPTSNSDSPLFVDGSGKAKSLGAMPGAPFAAIAWHNGTSWQFAKFSAGKGTIDGGNTYVDITHGATYANTSYAVVASAEGSVEPLRVEVRSTTVIRIHRAGTTGALVVHFFTGGS